VYTLITLTLKKPKAVDSGSIDIEEIKKQILLELSPMMVCQRSKKKEREEILEERIAILEEENRKKSE